MPGQDYRLFVHGCLEMSCFPSHLWFHVYVGTVMSLLIGKECKEDTKQKTVLGGNWCFFYSN